MESDALIWVFGFGRKSAAAIADAARVLGQPLTQDAFPDYALETVHRLRGRWLGAPMPTLLFGAPNVRMTMGGIAVRCAERSVRARRIVLEDHGLPGLAFVGADALCIRTLPEHQASIEHVRPFIDAQSELVLLHCQVMADGGAFGRALSAAIGCPVIGMDVDQTIGNRAYEGTAYRCTPTSTEKIDSIDRAVLHFD